MNKKIEEPLDFSLSPNNKKHPLAEATTEKDIGVTFDGQLSFDEHINSKVKTANMMAGLNRRSYKFLTVKTFLPLYKSLVRVHFDYAASVWSPHLQKHIDIIEGVQKRATKYLPGIKDKNYEDRLKLLDLPTLAYRLERADMIETYKLIKELYDPEVAPKLELMKKREHMRLRGHDLKLFKVRANKNVRLKAFSSRITNPWNSLPKEVVEAPTLNTFKRRLDKSWKNQEILYNYKATLNVGTGSEKLNKLEDHNGDVVLEDREDL